jgi:hypothetical protein
MGRRRCIGFGKAGAQGPVSGIVGYGGDEEDYQDVDGLYSFVMDNTLGLVLDNLVLLWYRGEPRCLRIEVEDYGWR